MFSTPFFLLWRHCFLWPPVETVSPLKNPMKTDDKLKQTISNIWSEKLKKSGVKMKCYNCKINILYLQRCQFIPECGCQWSHWVEAVGDSGRRGPWDAVKAAAVFGWAAAVRGSWLEEPRWLPPAPAADLQRYEARTVVLLTVNKEARLATSNCLFVTVQISVVDPHSQVLTENVDKDLI